MTYVRMDLIRHVAVGGQCRRAGDEFPDLPALRAADASEARWIEPPVLGNELPTLHLFLGAFAWLQMLAVLFNLVPVPGLDGFGIVRPYPGSEHAGVALLAAGRGRRRSSSGSR